MNMNYHYEHRINATMHIFKIRLIYLDVLCRSAVELAFAIVVEERHTGDVMTGGLALLVCNSSAAASAICD